MAKLLRVPTPTDRGPGQLWRPGTPPPAPIPADTPSADIRVGYARCSHLTQELQSQLDALAAHRIPREKIFAEKVSTRVRVRPKFEAALDACRQIKAHAPHCRVILTVYEMKRIGRDSAELTALADHLTAHGIALEMLAGPLTGIYDPTGTGRVLFAFFAAMAETERENRPPSRGSTPPPAKGVTAETAGHHRRHAAHRAAAARQRRIRRVDPPRPDHPRRQTQGTHPEPGQHLPGDRREREAAVVPRGRRPSPGRLRLSPDQRLIDRPLESPLLNEPPGPYPPDLRRVLLRPR